MLYLAYCGQVGGSSVSSVAYLGFHELQYIEKLAVRLTTWLEASFQHDSCANTKARSRNIGDRTELHILGNLKVH